MSLPDHAARASLNHAVKAYRGSVGPSSGGPAARAPRVATATTATSRIRQQECAPKLSYAFEAALNKADNYAALQKVIAGGFKLTRESAMRALSLPYLSRAASALIEAEMDRRHIVLSVSEGMRLLGRCTDERRRLRWMMHCDLDGLTAAEAFSVSRAMLAADTPAETVAKWLAECPTDMLVGTLLSLAGEHEPHGAYLPRLLAALRKYSPDMRPAQALLYAQQKVTVRFTAIRDSDRLLACLGYGLHPAAVLEFRDWPQSKDVLLLPKFRSAYVSCARNFTFDKRRHALMSWARFQEDEELWYP